MAAFTALALGLLGGALLGQMGSGGNDDTTRGTVGRGNPNAPTPLATPATPPSTSQNASAAIPQALNASDRAKKRAAAGDTILTAAQIPTSTAQPQTQPRTLLGS
jgi:hypothetical protein